MKKLLVSLKKKDRFNSSQGPISHEQLFDLSLTDLDNLYRSLETELPDSKGLSGRKSNPAISRKMEVVKVVYEYNENLQLVAEKRANILTKKELLLEAANQAEVQELTEGKTSEELRKAAAKLS